MLAQYAAAGVLMGDGHDVVLHARTRQRAAVLSDLAPDGAGVVVGDLSSTAETRGLADQVGATPPYAQTRSAFTAGTPSSGRQ